jgi:putative ABC transport system permease protein
MTKIRRFLARLLATVRSRRAETELAREINAHLRLLEDEHVARGLSREDARLAARRAFGGVEQAKEHQRDARAFRWLDNARIDFKLGARMLAKYPALSLIGGAGLAAGVAIGAAFFAFLYSLLYATLPVEGGERIVALENWDLEANSEMRRSMHDLVRWQREMKTVGEIGAFRTLARNLTVAVTVAGGPVEAVEVAQITATGFNITGVKPVIGRAIGAADESAGAPPIVVIGYDVWQSRFGGDASVLGRELRLGNVVHTIVGVMPEGYGFPVNHRYWIPLSTNAVTFGPREGPDIFIFGRLRDGVTLRQAQAELSTLGARAASAFPLTHARLRPRVMPYAYPILDLQGGSALRDFAAIQSMVSLLALIIAVNVGVLVCARTATRERELAVRTALGASRRRIVGQLFIEALVLSAAASAAGIGLARFGLAQGLAIYAANGNVAAPYFLNLAMPWAAYGYVALLTVFAAVVAGVLPALHATGWRAQDTLKQASGGTGGLRLGRLWTAMIIAQVAIAVIGLPATIKIGWDGIQGGLTKANYNEESFLAATLSADPDAPAGMAAAVYERESAMRFARLTANLVSDLEAEPAVADVTVASTIPGAEPRARIAIDDAVHTWEARFNGVAPDFFDAFGARVIAGRALRDSDSTGATQAVVVNRAFVNQLLGGANAVGHRLHYVKDAPVMHYEIVGVVTDLATNRIAPDLIDPVIYHGLRSSTRATALIRMRGNDPLPFSSRFRALTAALDPTLRLRIVTFSEMKRQQMMALRLMLLACSLVVVTVLLLSAAGISAMMSFTVSQRRKEIGIRTAVGADAGQLLRSIFTKAALQLAAGVAAGIVLAFVADHASDGELLGPFGRALLPVTAVVMTIVGLFATLGPARRGLRIQPTEALRAE